MVLHIQVIAVYASSSPSMCFSWTSVGHNTTQRIPCAKQCLAVLLCYTLQVDNISN